MSRAVWFGLIVGLVVVIGGAVFLYRYNQATLADFDYAQPRVLADDALGEAVPKPADIEPLVAHPVPVPEPVEGQSPLPELDDSDEAALGTLRELFGAESVESFLVPKEVVRRLVLTIDSLDRQPLPLWLRPIRRVPGSFAVQAGETVTINPENTARYDRLIESLNKVDVQQLAGAYKRHYPLFQDAYDNIGNPRSRYFNDRLIAIIDHLLYTPDVAEPIALVRPKGVYQFADPELEALSSGQKMMLRIGSAHRATVEAKLKSIRPLIATGYSTDE